MSFQTHCYCPQPDQLHFLPPLPVELQILFPPLVMGHQPKEPHLLVVMGLKENHPQQQACPLAVEDL